MFANDQKKYKIEQIKNWIVSARRSGAIVSEKKLRGTIMQIFGTSLRTTGEYISELKMIGFVEETEGELYLDKQREKEIQAEREEQIRNEELALKELSSIEVEDAQP